jgi:hypothetical protein
VEAADLLLIDHQPRIIFGLIPEITHARPDIEVIDRYYINACQDGGFRAASRPPDAVACSSPAFGSKYA